MKTLLWILVPWLLLGCSSSLSRPGVRIEGNRVVSDGDLASAAERDLDRFFAKERRPADADDAAFSMEAFLRGEGYPEARVAFAIQPGSVVFRVDEGPLATFGRVRFEGVESVSETDLVAFFDFEGRGPFGLGSRILDPAEVESAVGRVEDHYLERGYRRVEVEDPEVEWNAERTIADVVVRVTEGPLYLVEDLRVTGADPSLVADEDVVGNPYRQGMPFQVAGRVRRDLRDEGYAFAQVKGTSEIDDERARVVVHVDVERGEQMRLREVRVTGNNQTRTDFIRKRIGLARGAVVRRDVLERGVADLYRSRLLRRVNADLENVGAGQVDLLLDVKEANTKRLDLELGWGSWEMLRGEVTYKDFNLFGMGRVIRATALASMKSYGAEVQLEDPWILGQDNRIWVTLGGGFREDRFYDYQGYLAELAVERRFTRRLKLWGGYRFQLDEATNIAADIPVDEQEAVEGFQRSAGLFAVARYEDRDDRFIPTKGWLVEARGLWSEPALGASLSFLELEARASYHLPIRDGSVLAFGLRGASSQPFGSTVLPIQRRYFLGGAQSVRSFGQDQLTPTDASGRGIGALTVAEAHVEWRQRLIGIVHGALVYDLGYVAVDPWSLDGEFGHGLGAGLRLYTPVGPVRMDAAYNPGPLFAAGNRWDLHFSFGFSF